MSGVNMKKPTCDVAIYPSRGNTIKITWCGKPAVTSGYAANVLRQVCANHRYILDKPK